MTKTILNIIILLSLVLMAGLSVFGAFLGSERAGAVAGSFSFVILGTILAMLFGISFLRFPGLLARPGLLMIHVGCVAVLAGGLWGGKWSHSIRMTDITTGQNGPAQYGKLYKSVLFIDEGGYASVLNTKDDNGTPQICPLDFNIYLKDFALEYYPSGQLKDYISEIMIIGKNGRHFGPYVVEVNRPLYFGGYHFYQHSYGQDGGVYTVLKVVSDDGLWLVYAGYFLLLSGVCWHLWLEPALQWYHRPQEAVNA